MVNLIQTISFHHAEFSYPELFKLVDVSINIISAFIEKFPDKQIDLKNY